MIIKNLLIIAFTILTTYFGLVFVARFLRGQRITSLTISMLTIGVVGLIATTSLTW